MFKYLINNKEVTFENRADLIKALEEAEMMGYSIEDITDKKEKPKKKEEEKDPILASIEANTPKEDFTQGPVERADAASETVAQDGMVSPPADGSLGFQPIPLGDGTMPDVGGSVPFSIDGKEVTEEEYKKYEESLTPVPEFNPYISDVVERSNLQQELEQTQQAIESTPAMSEEYKGLSKRAAELQSMLDESVGDRLFSIYGMPDGIEKNQAISFLTEDQKNVFNATIELSKDTGGYSAALEYDSEKDLETAMNQLDGPSEDGMMTVAPKRNKQYLFGNVQRLVNEMFGFSKDTAPNEVVKYDKEVYSLIAQDLLKNKATTGRLNYNTLTLTQKNNLIKEARINAYKNASQQNKSEAEATNLDFIKNTTIIQNQAAQLSAEIKEIIGSTPKNMLTQAQVDAVNIRIKEINSLQAKLDRTQSEAKDKFNQLVTSQETLAGTYKIDTNKETIGNVFKKSDLIEQFKKQQSANLGGWAKGINSTLQGYFQIALEAEVALPTMFLAKGGSLLLGAMTDDFDSYNIYDAFVDTAGNNLSYDALGVEASTAFEGGGGVLDQSASELFALGGEGLGFTLQLMKKGRSGQIKNMQNSIGKLTKPGSKFKRIFSNENVEWITAKATMEATLLSNYTAALDSGMDKNDALLYSTEQSLMTAAVQMIYPDIKMVTPAPAVLKQIKGLTGNLRTAAIKKAVYGTAAKLLGGVSMEYLEELTESVSERALNLSFAIDNSEFMGGDWWIEQKKLMASTLMISGPLSGVGAAKTGMNIYDNFMGVADWQMKNVIMTFDTQLSALKKEKAKPGSSITDEQITKLEEAISLAIKVQTAINSSPKNVTGQELELLVEKQRLIEENKKLDPAFQKENNDKIEKIDQQIAVVNKEGKTAVFIQEAVEGDVKRAEAINKELGLGASIQAAESQEDYEKQIEATKNTRATDKNGVPVEVKSDGFGAIIPMADGSDVIILNKQAAIRGGRINTAAHELLHRYLKNSLTDKGMSINEIGAALEDYYLSLGLQSNKEFEVRRAQYAEMYGGVIKNKAGQEVPDYKKARENSVYNEEMLTLLSEAMLDNKVKSGDGRIASLIDSVKRMLNLGKDISLDDGASVFNFVKDYNRSIKKGKASKSIKKGVAGIKGSLVKKQGEVSEPTSKQSMQIEGLEQTYFDLQDQAAEDPNNLALYERMEKAGDALDAALAAPATEATPMAEAVQEASKEVIVRPKADKSKRKYSLDKEVKKEIEPKIAEAQKLNKELIAQEKKLNADAIAEIEAIDDNVESRTSREKRIVALKNKPLTVRKPPALNKLEKEITEALETPINKAVNLFTKLYYDKIAKNATAAVTREEFMQSAKAEITSLTINEFKPETINRAGEDVINDIEDIIFQRGGLRLRNLAQRLGVIGKDQGISRGAEALTKIAAEDSTTTAEPAEKNLDSGFKGEIRKPSALLADESLIEQAKKKIIQFWETNKGNKKVENFKNLPIIIDSILAEVYGISLDTLTARSGNFNKVTYQNAITAFTTKQAVFRTEENGEMVEVRVPYDQRDAKLEELENKAKENSNFTFEEYSPESRAEGILRFLPELSVPEYKYFSGKRGRSAGKSTGMPRSFTSLAYLVTGRRTQAQGNREGEIQKISREELLESIGAIDDSNGNAVPDVAKAREAGKAINKMPGAQTLLSLIKLEGRMIANQMSREFGNLDPLTELDIKMGKNKTMYSAPLKIILAPVNIEMFKPENFKNKAIPYEAADEIYKILNKENKIRKKKLNIIDVSNIILKQTAKSYGREVGAVYRNAALDVMQKFDAVGYKIAEAKIKLIKDLQYSFGKAFKYVIQNKAINKEWGKVEALKKKGVSKETKIQVIKDYVERWNRAGRDIDYRFDFDFLKATNNTAVFDAIKEATGLSDTQLKNLGFTLEKIGGLTTINFEGKPLKLSTSADSLKKDLNSADVAKNNAAAITINKEAGTIRKVMFDVLDPFIKKGDIEGAKAMLALMDLSQNGIARKLGKMGSLIKMNADDKTILDHNPSMSDVNAKIIEYIEGKRSKTSLNSYLDKTTINNISEQLNDLLDLKGGLDSKRYDVLKNTYAKINVNYAAKEVAIAKENKNSLPLNLRQEGISLEESIKRVENFDKAITLGNSLDQPTKGISVWDFDDTLATTKSNVLFTMPDGTKGKLNASRFAKEGDAMLANGAKFDFSEFSKVMNGAKGPFFNKAVDRNRKFGNKDVYVLTARPANSANAIHEFLKGIGLDIPLANITGLASSDPQAKANWVVGKFAEGYNDFYFADDHVGNVNAVSTALSALDNVRSNVELAKAARYSKKIRREYSTILDKLRGGDVIEGNKVFSAEQQIDEVFDWANSLNIPEKNKGKYKRAALNFVAKSPTNFPVDAEIVNEAMRIAELKKLDVMNFNNPREIIDKFAGEVKAKRLDPNKEKEFFNKKSLPEGVETFQIMPNRWGQLAVRKMLDTHWGEKTNPWCVTVQESGYTAAEQKELKENPPFLPVGTKSVIQYEAIVDAGVVVKQAFDNARIPETRELPLDFVGNLKTGWVAGETTYESVEFDDTKAIRERSQADYDRELAAREAKGFKVEEGSFSAKEGIWFARILRNNDPKVNKVRQYTTYYKAKNPNMTQEEFDNGPAKGGTVKNPEITPTGPVELTFGSRKMWRNYGKPISREFVNEDTGDVEVDDGGFEIAFKDGKLLGLKNLGGQKQQWFDRMDTGTDQLALNVPRNAKGNITGQSTMMNTDSGKVFKKDYTELTRYSKKIEPTLNNLIDKLSTKGDAVNSSTTNLKAQPKEVKEVINTLDVKSDTQQARVRYSMDLNKRFNEIIEEKSGIESFKEYQSVKAGKKGAKKGRLSFFIPPSAEDFLGLLYKTLPKGKKGESAMAFYKEHLIDPYWKGVSGLRTQRISIAKQYKALKKELGIVPRKLKKTFKYEDENGNMKESLFSKEDAIRVYVWDSQGLDIEGLSNVDLPVLVNYVNSQPDLKAFADKLLELNKNNPPKAPTESWPGGTITSDLLNTLNTEGRKKMLEVWQQNVDAIFSKTNLNKLEAAFGAKYVEALKSSLDAMETGKSSKPTGNRVTDGFVRWLNAAVGNIMFLNRRSAVLQLISFTNFINFEGNNLYQAGKAFADQPQYWKDWAMLMNSDYLVDRRDGLKINVNEADIATTAKENGFQGVLAKVLQAGFTPTKVADSVAIATGGATFYRNKVNALVKGGMNLAAAEKQAMLEFMDVAEKTQQSSDPIMTSKQQREPIGRIILAFANTPSQYARIIKRSTQDLIAGRGDPKTHLSRIAYYGFLQNAIFNFLQQGMFAAMMGDDDDDEDDSETPEALAKQEESKNKKMFKVANSMTDGILRGTGVGGAIVSAVKNLAIKFYERSQKTRNQRLAETLKDGVTAVSPPLSSKLSKIGKVGNSLEWGKKEIEFDEMSLKHPYVTAASNAIAAATGLPADRAVGMAIDAVDIASSETETWMKPLIALGWPKWQLMSEEDTQKEREEKKERFTELEADKEFQELNPTEQRRSVLKKLSKKEQEKILWNSGVLTRKQIRNLKSEANRVDKIMALRDKKQFEKDMESLSKGGDILPEPKVTRPPTKRKDSLK